MYFMRGKLGSFIPEDGILQSPHRNNLKSYIALTGWALERRRNVSVRYELGFYIQEDDILHSHRRENLKSLHSKLFVSFDLSHRSNLLAIFFSWDTVTEYLVSRQGYL
jgi:hypothetical protein